MGTGQRIKDRLKKAGLTAAELSRRTGIPATTLRSIMTKDTTPKADTLTLIADALGCTVIDLLAVGEKNGILTFESGSDFDLAWRSSSARIEKPEGVTDEEYYQVVQAWALKDIKTVDDRKYIKALSVPALKLNASGRNLLLHDAELYATYDYLTKQLDDHGTETEETE